MTQKKRQQLKKVAAAVKIFYIGYTLKFDIEPKFKNTLFAVKHAKSTLFQVKKRAFCGGQGWIRTTEVSDGRFTVCSLWPLGNLPILELAIGIEPTTC